MKPHLSSYDVPISTSPDVYICLQDIWFVWRGTEELYVNFIVVSGVVLVVWKLKFPKSSERKIKTCTGKKGFTFSSCRENLT